jgi:plasmid stabilization system protein ParE
MARIEFAPEVADDFDRIFDHLAQFDPQRAAARIEEIVRAIDALEVNPHIGQPAAGGERELVIGRGSSGDVALYRGLDQLDLVLILAVRSQREAGYRRE